MSHKPISPREALRRRSLARLRNVLRQEEFYNWRNDRRSRKEKPWPTALGWCAESSTDIYGHEYYNPRPERVPTRYVLDQDDRLAGSP